ncbi:allatostatin-A receptor [Nilaparvata lugens]|uniref:Neuropeptide GPCR A2 n=1 Tax=Nilaparvata lugens TaxID=108931 RepID=U3U4C5_NILLU|nr:allatostatin-A receptor [Nilaparvata lugens]BAO01051.1 neuropeptide GPCR A2 [Nilaparvata lugens]
MAVPPNVMGVGIPVFMYNNCLNLTNLSEVAFCQNASSISTPEDNGDPDSFTVMEKIVSIAVPILFGIIVLLGLFGNLLVVIVVAANQQMRSTTNLLIINLAVADLLFIVFCVPFTATDYILPFWPFGDFWCKTVQYLICVTAYASVYTLVLMSLDRFLAVVHPIASMSVRTERNAITAIVVVWVVIVVGCVPVFLSHGVASYVYSSNVQSACVYLQYDPVNRPDGHNKPLFQITFFTTSYVVPLALICGLYLCMIMRLWRGVAPGGHCSAESRRGKKRVTRMVVVVVAIFAICWCPIQVILVLKSVDRYEITNTSVMVQIVSHVLAYMNSCVNPILYAFLSENFRKAFRKVIYCGPDRAHMTGQINGPEKSALTKTTRTNDIL